MVADELAKDSAAGREDTNMQRTPRDKGDHRLLIVVVEGAMLLPIHRLFLVGLLYICLSQEKCG